MSARITSEQLEKLQIVSPDRRWVKPRISKQEAIERAKLEEIQAVIKKRQDQSKLIQKPDGGGNKIGNSAKNQQDRGDQTSVRSTMGPKEIRIDLKPMSVNTAWKGKRFKSEEYDVYSQAVMALLPKFEMPAKPYRISYEFGFSTRNADIDNGIKPLQDILCKKYGFNDRDIYFMEIRKVIVKKGLEYIKFRIESP